MKGLMAKYMVRTRSSISDLIHALVDCDDIDISVEESVTEDDTSDTTCFAIVSNKHLQHTNYKTYRICYQGNARASLMISTRLPVGHHPGADLPVDTGFDLPSGQDELAFELATLDDVENTHGHC